jgi:hypothetical protein
VDFIIINHILIINKYITFTSQKIAGNSQTNCKGMNGKNGSSKNSDSKAVVFAN